MGKLSTIDIAIKAINFDLEDRKSRVDKLQKRMDLSENQRIFIGAELSLIRNFNILLKAYTEGINKTLGRLPPQATDLEDAVLGAIMLEGNPVRTDNEGKKYTVLTAMETVFPYLKAEHFYRDQNRTIYEACLQLHAVKKPIDMRTVVFELRRVGKIELVGNAGYIAELTSKVSSSANIDFHARIIVEMAVKRELILTGSLLINNGYEDTKDCFELLNQADENIQELKNWIK